MYFSTVFRSIVLAATALPVVLGCDDCYGPVDLVTHERVVKRMQPGVPGAAYGPSRPLEWGQINFMHTTDTHGWLEGHLKEQNYGADWGDFVSFTKHIRNKAAELNVDFLLVDTGDLHDGAGLSDATSLNGELSNPIFENVDYDLLTIGNHELYVSDIAYETFYNFSRVYGDKYLTSNVQIFNPATGNYSYIGSRFRYFSTPKGLRIMAFGVLYDFTGNSNASIVTKGADMIKQQWFLDAIKYPKPIDLFVLIGHNPVRGSGSTLTTVYKAIRAANPNTPIAVFGGHTHIRDLAVYDSMAVGLEAGRYCETLGWLSLTGINSPTYFGAAVPSGVPNPTKIAVVPSSSSSTSSSTPTATSGCQYLGCYTDQRDHPLRTLSNNGIIAGGPQGVTIEVCQAACVAQGYMLAGLEFANECYCDNVLRNGGKLAPDGNAGCNMSCAGNNKEICGGPDRLSLYNCTLPTKPSTTSAAPTASASASPYRWSRRYLDWNRLTFAFHATLSQNRPFDVDKGVTVSEEIFETRNQLNLTNGSLFGCVPTTYCQFCKPIGDPGNINTFLPIALAATVINQTRKAIPRLIIINSGSIRFDLVQGPFTFDDSFIVSPFNDAFQYIPLVPYSIASKVLGILNAGAFQKRAEHDDSAAYNPFGEPEACLDPTLGHISSDLRKRTTRGIIRRQSTTLVPGYTTTDDFGTDGDDTPHSKIPNFSQPNDIQANASFPADGSLPTAVDLIFLDFIGASFVIPALKQAGGSYTQADIQYYLPPTFTTNSYLPAYAKLAWQANINNCPVGKGVGF